MRIIPVWLVSMAVLLTLGTFVSTSAGGLFALRHRDRLHLILGFSAGVILSVVAFDILPEIDALSRQTGVGFQVPMIALVVGFLGFHVVEKGLLIHKAHEYEYGTHAHPAVGKASALALAGHSLTDGIAIGLAFQVDQTVGIAVALAIIGHDFADGLNTVSLMLTHRNSRRSALKFLLLDAAAPARRRPDTPGARSTDRSARLPRCIRRFPALYRRQRRAPRGARQTSLRTHLAHDDPGRSSDVRTTAGNRVTVARMYAAGRALFRWHDLRVAPWQDRRCLRLAYSSSAAEVVLPEPSTPSTAAIVGRRSATTSWAIDDAGRPAVIVHEDDFVAPRKTPVPPRPGVVRGYFPRLLRPGSSHRPVIGSASSWRRSSHPAPGVRSPHRHGGRGSGRGSPVLAVVIVEGLRLHRDELVDRWAGPSSSTCPPPRLLAGWDTGTAVGLTRSIRRWRRYVHGQRSYLAGCRTRKRATVVLDNTRRVRSWGVSALSRVRRT